MDNEEPLKLHFCFQSTQLFLGHKLTAHRAQEMGLVSESIWPATYQQELIPKVALLATQSAQVSVWEIRFDCEM